MFISKKHQRIETLRGSGGGRPVRMKKDKSSSFQSYELVVGAVGVMF